MKTRNSSSSFDHLHSALLTTLGVAALLLAPPDRATAQTLLLANPHWNITLTDFGYSDFLLDNTPGFEGREYLSGEWGAAVGYQLSGGTVVAPKFLEPNFIYPDWATGSPFHVLTPLTLTGLNADSLPIAQSVITNSDLQITLRHEMLDTVVGTPMGTTPASAPGPTNALNSSRYVLKQTCTIKNISGTALANVQLFQFLHGFNAQRGVYDHRPYAGPLGAFRYDVTQAGVDPWAVGAGSSSAGLEDFIAFHASVAPSAYEIGHYGLEGNGVDDHFIGRPSDGVHLSIMDNWQNPPFSTRQGTDNFIPAQRWVSGAQRWNLGSLPAGQSVGLDVILSLRTGTKVTTGIDSSGGCNGGASVPGGVDYVFDDVSIDGSCFGEYSKADASELALHISQGEIDAFTFLTPGGPAQLWKLQFTGTFTGAAHLTFAYDPTILPPGFDESSLCLYEFNEGGWHLLTSSVDTLHHTIAVVATNLSSFALGTAGGVTCTMTASVAPANSGSILGTNTYMVGSSVTLVTAANAGYVFSNWAESGSAVSTSPSYTFLAQADRALVANFVPVGAARSITTSSTPASGGSTSGDGAYASGASATVNAIPNPGYKFSKWLTNGVSASIAANYTFTVTRDLALVAKFKPVYTVVVTADPTIGGELEADPVYESGELAKLKAKPFSGYCFVNWTQNGVPVSTATNFQFNVTGNRELVGHFALGNRIDARAEPLSAGTAAGGGIYTANATVDLTATANPGYVFYTWTEDISWTEGGAVVSSSLDYQFSSNASRKLVANFIAQPSLRSLLTAPDALTVSWPASAAGWGLQECTNLNYGSWADSLRPVNVVDGQKQVTISPPTGSQFFRLTHP